jgi:CheY-like chemotaxis protein
LFPSGVAAIEELQQLADPHSAPDLILMRWRLPFLHGPEAVAALRSIPALYQAKLVVLLAPPEPTWVPGLPGVDAVLYRPVWPPISPDKLLTLLCDLSLLPVQRPAGR